MKAFEIVTLSLAAIGGAIVIGTTVYTWAKAKK